MCKLVSGVFHLNFLPLQPTRLYTLYSFWVCFFLMFFFIFAATTCLCPFLQLPLVLITKLQLLKTWNVSYCCIIIISVCLYTKFLSVCMKKGVDVFDYLLMLSVYSFLRVWLVVHFNNCMVSLGHRLFNWLFSSKLQKILRLGDSLLLSQ